MARGGRRRPEVEDEAVVLRTAPLGEADLLVTLFGRTLGRVRCAARMARRSTRRFAGGLAVGGRGRARVALVPGGLGRLHAFVPSKDAPALSRELRAFACRGYVAELTDALLAEGDPDPEVFDALVRAVHVLDDPTGAAVPILRWYEIVLLRRLGAMPALDRCAVCGAATDAENVSFAWERGGALCRDHATGGAGVPAEVLAAVGSFAAWSGEGRGPELDAATLRFVRGFLQRALAPHLRRPLRSLSVLRDLLRDPAGGGPGRAAGSRDETVPRKA
ncbi:MAG: DNA repair protein RecO [Deltaproteobacteria bacterium]|nr:MAG: DNA repair protein RecO [Deltaproteobacteria bacterium]